MPALKLAIPADLSFSSLGLSRTSDGEVEFDLSCVERICEYNGIDLSVFTQAPEDNVGSLLSHWYGLHLTTGGAPDPVMEDLISEADLEDRHGDGFSYPPGRG
jgi:hypothetical protein